MLFNGNEIEIGAIDINDSESSVPSTKCFDIYSGDYNYRLSIWSIVPYTDFLRLKLNEKVDGSNLFDKHGVCFGTRENTIICDGSYVNIYVTKVDTNKILLNVEISKFVATLMGDTTGYNSLKVETIIELI